MGRAEAKAESARRVVAAAADLFTRSTGKMTLVYQHITDGVRRDVASKVGSFIWGNPKPT